MSAPLIWILLPLVVSVVLWFLKDRHQVVILLAAGLCLLLAFLAWRAPIDSLIQLGPVSFIISSTLTFLGRSFILASSNSAFLILIYLIGAFWLFGAIAAGVPDIFVPLGLALISLLVAALSVQPFLYAALLIEVAVLLSIPMLVPPGKTAGQGVIRYLIFQTLALPFILLAGWAAAGVEANPTDQKLLIQAVVLLGLGFAFWLAVFPFYAWVPLLAGEAHPYVAGFILSLLPTVVLLLMLDFLNAFAWLRAYPLLPEVLQLVGALMVITGGMWSAFQRDLSRLFGYAVIMESGFSLLALSLGNQAGLQVLAASFLPRMLALGLWALSLSIIGKQGSVDFNSLEGLLHRQPFTAAGFLLAYFSLGGLPLLAGFPMREILLEGVAQQNVTIAFWTLLGNLGFLASGFRILAVLAKSSEKNWQIQEKWMQIVLLSGGGLALFLVGIYPRIFLSGVLNLLRAFERLV
jgi:NADH-quinone oxidoreductase subunit N